MGNVKDMIHFKTNQLEVISYSGIRNNRATWKCVCICGNTFVTDGKSLRNGSTTSCGCFRKRVLSEQGVANRTHNETGTRIYDIWRGMKKRCRLKTNKLYSNYGMKGIEMCDEWYDSYESFRDWSWQNGYSKDLTIDRIDVTKGYFPENCRWADWYTQENNRGNNVHITYGGEQMTKSEAARKVGISSQLLQYRVAHNIPIDKPKRLRKSNPIQK